MILGFEPWCWCHCYQRIPWSEIWCCATAGQNATPLAAKVQKDKTVLEISLDAMKHLVRDGKKSWYLELHCRFSRLTWKGGKPPKQRLKVGDTVVLPRNPPLWQRSFVWQSFQHQDLKSLKQISKNAMSPITTKTPYLAGCIGYKVCLFFRLIQYVAVHEMITYCTCK